MGEVLRSAGERFSRKQVCRIVGFTERQLANWERQGLVRPTQSLAADANPCADRMPEGPGKVFDHSAQKAHAFRPGSAEKHSRKHTKKAAVGGCYYTFADIVALKRLVELQRDGVPPARLRRVNAALKRTLAEVESPWSQLQIKNAGKKLLVHFQGAVMEPVTGQFLFEYAAKKPSDSKPPVRPFHVTARQNTRSEAETKAKAERFFEAGLKFEEGGSPPEKAVRAYQKAIELNPQAVGAYINLGTIFYNLGQLDAAESCYRVALSLDPGYGLVHFNLGNVADEKNELPAARKCYEEAIRCEPSYPDPHYNLALVYEKLGLHGKARQQWLHYLKLDRNSQWASFARLQLEKTSLRVIRRRDHSEDCG